VSALIQALQDQDSQVRANVVLALEQIGTPEALKVVEEYNDNNILTAIHTSGIARSS
tara:strand:- start:519 stop:689 length:171 start_codon:yes stop_codon:yes gene_type:complete